MNDKKKMWVKTTTLPIMTVESLGDRDFFVTAATEIHNLRKFELSSYHYS